MKIFQNKISLKTALLFFFAGTAIVSVVTVGLISFFSGREAVKDVAIQLRTEIIERIHRHVQDYLLVPQRINQANARALSTDKNLASDQMALVARFAEQVEMFPSITSISFGNPQGGLANSGRHPEDDSRYAILTDSFKAGPFRKTALEPDLGLGGTIAEVPGFDARTRPWYIRARQTGGPVYSDIYIVFTGQDMSLAVSRPVYDQSGNFLGVAAVDLFLSHLSDFLAGLQVGDKGRAFILERSGELVACSRGRVVDIDENKGTGTRIQGVNSPDREIRDAVRAMTSEAGSLEQIRGNQYLDFEADGRKFLIQVSTLKVDPDINWLVVVSLPRSDFMAGIRSQSRTTFAASLLVLAVVLFLGRSTARGIIRPIRLLESAANRLTSGEYPEKIQEESLFSETTNLTGSFNLMSGRLSGSIKKLNSELLERKAAEKELQKEKQLYQDLVTALPAGVYRLSFNPAQDWGRESIISLFQRRLTLEMASLRFHEILGLSHEVFPEPLMVLNVIHPEDKEDFQNKNILAQKTLAPFKWEGRIIKAGQIRWVHFESLPRRVDPDTIVWTGIVSDITDYRQIQEELLHSRKMESMGVLAGGIAHDFNNLLHAISGNLSLLETKTAEDPQVRKHIKTIKKSVERASRLVSQMLIFSRKSSAQRKTLDLNREIRESVTILERIIPKMISIELELDKKPMFIKADPVQMEQVLLNLAKNAADAISSEGRITIETRSMQVDQTFADQHPGLKTGDYVLLCVSDTGCGMDKFTADKIFEPFFTTKDVGKGTGMGLATAYGIIKAHEGYIDCSSAPGHGTTFSVYLPGVKNHELPETVQEHDEKPPGGTETILVVDDEPEIREITRESLETLGYTVLSADSGEQALEIYQIQGQNIDLVLLDLNMPGIGGHVCLKRLRELDPSVRVVISSGYSAQGQADTSELQEARGYIRKPYSMAELAATLRGVL